MSRETRKIKIGNISIGGDTPVSVQGMTKCPTSDISRLLQQATKMVDAGAEIIRIAVLDEKEASNIRTLKNKISIPVVADIHYSRKLALCAMANGADKIRINPGNLSQADIKETIKAATDYAIPMRLGINSGSVPIKGSLHDSMVNAAMDAVKLFQDLDFHSIVISLKSPSVRETVACYRKISELCDYPLHIGITEAGRGLLAESKSVLGIGALLLEGIGDTIRVSLTEPPEKEIKIGRAILQALDIRRFEPEIISCPTCGRTGVDIYSVLEKADKEIQILAKRYPKVKDLKIAIMGCGVNGPGEAKQADIGIAGGEGRFALFKKGVIIGSYDEETALQKLIFGIEELLK